MPEQQLWPRRDCLAHVVVRDAERSKAWVRGALQLPARAGAGTQAVPYSQALVGHNFQHPGPV